MTSPPGRMSGGKFSEPMALRHCASWEYNPSGFWLRDKSHLHGKEAKFGFAGQVQFVVDVAHVSLDRLVAQIEVSGDVRILEPATGHRENFPFARW